MARFWRHDEQLSPYSEDAFTVEELIDIEQSLRESSFIDDNSGKSIEERMLEVFRGRPPEWICFQAPDGVCYVNCFGVLHKGRSVLRLELQFEISDDLDSFMLTGMLINNRPQSERTVEAFEQSFATDEPEQDDGCEDGYSDEGILEEDEPEAVLDKLGLNHRCGHDQHRYGGDCEEDDGGVRPDYDGWDDYHGAWDDSGEEYDGDYDDVDDPHESSGTNIRSITLELKDIPDSVPDLAQGREIVGGHSDYSLLTEQRPFFDFDADYEEPTEDEEAENNYSVFGEYGAFLNDKDGRK